MLEHLKPVSHLLKPKSRNAVFADLMGVRGRLSAAQIPAFTHYIARVTKDHPRMLTKAIRLAALGYHFEKITRQQIAIHDFKEFLTAELALFREGVSDPIREAAEVRGRGQTLLARARERCDSLPSDFRYHSDGVEEALSSLQRAVAQFVDEVVGLAEV